MPNIQCFVHLMFHQSSNNLNYYIPVGKNSHWIIPDIPRYYTTTTISFSFCFVIKEKIVRENILLFTSCNWLLIGVSSGFFCLLDPEFFWLVSIFFCCWNFSFVKMSWRSLIGWVNRTFVKGAIYQMFWQFLFITTSKAKWSALTRLTKWSCTI